MKVIIAGGRTIIEPSHIIYAIEQSCFSMTEVVCGEAAGVDTMGKRWAEWHGIPWASFPANWDRHGKGAGHIRNGEMAAYADALIAIWDGKSRGTANMIEQACAHDLYIHIYHMPDVG